MISARTTKKPASATSTRRGSKSSHILYMWVSSSADQRYRVMDRRRGAVQKHITLRARNPGTPAPNQDMREDRDSDEGDEARDEQGMKLLRFGFRQTRQSS